MYGATAKAMNAQIDPMTSMRFVRRSPKLTDAPYASNLAQSTLQP